MIARLLQGQTTLKFCKICVHNLVTDYWKTRDLIGYLGPVNRSKRSVLTRADFSGIFQIQQPWTFQTSLYHDVCNVCNAIFQKSFQYTFGVNMLVPEICQPYQTSQSCYLLSLQIFTPLCLSRKLQSLQSNAGQSAWANKNVNTARRFSSELIEF